MSKWKSTKNHWAYKSDNEDILKRISAGWGKKPKTGNWITCPVCGKEVWKKLCFIRRSKELFCSRECFNKSKKGRIPENIKIAQAKSPFKKGKDNINWNGGINPYPKEWTGSLHYEVWKRDKNRCQICGKVGEKRSDLIVHHKDFTKKNCLIDNLQLLCRSCHMKVHWTRRKLNS